MTPKERATKSAAVMWEQDEASKWFGMEILDVDEGRATLSLTVMAHHCNGHGMCHGGVTHALADSAFAFACNSRNQGDRRPAHGHELSCPLSPGRPADRHRVATEVSLSGRSGIYDVRVTNQNNTLIAEFRGMSRAVGGQNFDE